MSLADPRTHHDAIIAAIDAAGVVVGDGTYPTDDYGWQGGPGVSAFIGYAIVYPLSQEFDGSLGCPDTDADIAWQVTCVGATRRQADAVAHAVNTALVGNTLTVAGRSVPRMIRDGGSGARRDDSVQPAQFIATPRYSLMSLEA